MRSKSKKLYHDSSLFTLFVILRAVAGSTKSPREFSVQSTPRFRDYARNDGRRFAMTASFGLSQRTLDEMRAIFFRHSQVKKVVVYGSRAMGNYHTGSDIDLTMYGDDLNYDDISRIHGELDDSSIPYLVDLSVFDRLNNSKLQDHINRRGQVFYDRYDGWESVKLGDVCKLHYGKALAKIDRLSYSEFPAYGANGIKTYAKKALHIESSIIVGRKGSAGEINKVNKPFWALDVAYYVTINENCVCLDLLYYIFSMNNFPSFAKGIKPGINRNDIYAIDVKLPPLNQQKQIVTKLDAVFEKIDQAVSRIDKQKKWASLLENTLLNDQFNVNDGSLYETVRFGDVINYVKNNGKNSQLPYVGMENISSSSMELLGEIIVPKTTSATFIFDDSHVMFGRLRPYLKKILLPSFKGQCSSEIFCLKPIINEVDRKFIAYWLLSPSVSKAINSTSTGSRMPRANMKLILDFDFILPSVQQQKQIVEKLDIAFEKIKKIKHTHQRIKANYQSLKQAILTQELGWKDSS